MQSHIEQEYLGIMQSYSLRSPDSLLLYVKLNASTIIIIHFSAGHRICEILWITRPPFLGGVSIINLIKKPDCCIFTALHQFSAAKTILYPCLFPQSYRKRRRMDGFDRAEIRLSQGRDRALAWLSHELSMALA